MKAYHVRQFFRQKHAILVIVTPRQFLQAIESRKEPLTVLYSAVEWQMMLSASYRIYQSHKS